MESKEERVLELFLNEPTKHWRFKDIVKNADVSERAASVWLRKLVEESIITRIKPDARMPYFTANYAHPNYDSRKRIYALEKMYFSGLLCRLQSLRNAKTVVIFGSFARGDWNTKSDIDVFILGDPEDLRFGTVWKGFGREVEIHAFRTEKDIKDIRSGLLKNVITGLFIKGSVHDLIKAAHE
ncbi:MAG: nucleotidyltransferase domain-containing protein [Nanoarchaeota archaeon]